MADDSKSASDVEGDDVSRVVSGKPVDVVGQSFGTKSSASITTKLLVCLNSVTIVQVHAHNINKIHFPY